MSALWWMALALLGGVGAVARFHLDAAIGGRVKGDFPYGTLAINTAGAFALGVLAGSDVVGEPLFLVGTGFLGSFTTFSTWMLETERLAEDGETVVAAANVVVSIAAGLAAAGVGWGLGATV